MNNQHVDSLGEKDREFEELLCLAFLFSHSVSDESSEAWEVPMPEDAGFGANLFYN